MYLLKSICSLPLFRKHANHITLVLLAVLLRWTATVVVCIVLSFEVHFDYVLHIFICVAINLHSDVFFTFVSKWKKESMMITDYLITHHEDPNLPIYIQIAILGLVSIYLCCVQVTNLFLFSILVQNVLITVLTCKYPELRQSVPSVLPEQRTFIEDKVLIIPDYAEPTSTSSRSVGTSCSSTPSSPRPIRSTHKIDPAACVDGSETWQEIDMQVDFPDGTTLRRRHPSRAPSGSESSPIEWEVVEGGIDISRLSSNESQTDVSASAHTPSGGFERFKAIDSHF